MFKLKLSRLGEQIYKGGNIEVLKPILNKEFKDIKELEAYFILMGRTKLDFFKPIELKTAKGGSNLLPQ